MTIVRNFSNVAPGASSTGVIAATKGGTGLASVGTSGYVLTSDGTNWTSAAAGGGGVTGYNGQLFTSSGTFTVPTGVTAIKVSLVGGGGGGGGGGAYFGSYSGAGTAGGTSTFSTLSQTGGGGGYGTRYVSPVYGNSGSGVVSGATLTSGLSYFGLLSSQSYVPYGYGGAGGAGAPAGPNCGCGPNPPAGNTGNTGAGNPLAIKFFTGLTPGGTISVTIGAGGSGGSGASYGGQSSSAGSAGISGAVLVEW